MYLLTYAEPAEIPETTTEPTSTTGNSRMIISCQQGLVNRLVPLSGIGTVLEYLAGQC